MRSPTSYLFLASLLEPFGIDLIAAMHRAREIYGSGRWGFDPVFPDLAAGPISPSWFTPQLREVLSNGRWDAVFVCFPPEAPTNLPKYVNDEISHAYIGKRPGEARADAVERYIRESMTGLEYLIFRAAVDRFPVFDLEHRLMGFRGRGYVPGANDEFARAYLKAVGGSYWLNKNGGWPYFERGSRERIWRDFTRFMRPLPKLQELRGQGWIELIRREPDMPSDTPLVLAGDRLQAFRFQLMSARARLVPDYANRNPFRHLHPPPFDELVPTPLGFLEKGAVMASAEATLAYQLSLDPSAPQTFLNQRTAQLLPLITNTTMGFIGTYPQEGMVFSWVEPSDRDDDTRVRPGIRLPLAA